MQRLRIWRFPILTAAIFLFSTMGIQQLWAGTNESIEINSGWEFSQISDTKGAPIQSKWLPAEVPGDVHLDLLRNKKISRPFYRDNEAKLQWIENADWEYRTTVSISPKFLAYRNIDLIFDGLDTCARVSSNGNPVLTSHNMFRTYRIDAKSYLKSGANELVVEFPSPIRCAARIAAKDKWRPETHTQERSYLRKAVYEYGWDWGPRFVTSGIWQPVRLEGWNNARIEDLNIRQLDVTSQVAHVLAQVEVISSMDKSADVEVDYEIDGKQAHFSEKTELHTGINHVDVPITVNKPALWYPAGYGQQPIYAFHAEIKIAGAIQDTKDVRTGLRSVVLRREPDQWGRTFEFVVNGIPIFAKGANIIPFDSFPNRVSVDEIRHILQSAKDANMNMVRVWGGGYYESQEFYRICDELGIMVWQDFMFGNNWQPGTYSFKQNVAQEVEDQLKRLRNHPSIVLWCGNNEQESNFKNDSAHVTPEAKLQMWQDYLTVFSGIIPEKVARFDPATPYWPSSPSADYEETKDRNYRELEEGDSVAGNEESGDTHDYTIWASDPKPPRTPFNDEQKHHYRFVSEYGFQAFPDMRTIKAFTLPQDRTSLGTPVMKAHQKAVAGPGSSNGYETIHDYMLQYYGEPKDLSSLVYASQVLQAEAIKVIAEHLRQGRPHTMGSLYWQLNDCWPGITWSSIDYYGRWKALQYYARRFYAPLLVSSYLNHETLNVYVVSDKTKPLPASLRVRIMKFDGTILREKTKTVTIPALSSRSDMQLPIDSIATKGTDPASIFAAMDLTVDGKQVSSNVTYFVPTKQVHLPAAHIESHFTEADGVYDLHLSSPVLARSVFVSFGDDDAHLSDNYFDLLPGESRDIRVSGKESLEHLKKNMKIVSLVDAFVTNPNEKGFNWN